MKALRVSSWLGAAALSLVVAPLSKAASTTVFYDSFERPENTRNWQVYANEFGEWDVTGGTGIEIQTSGVVVNAHHGNQYVELDSDSSRGGSKEPGTGTNSSMTTILNGLVAGDYQLDFFYQPRTSNDSDNDINVYFDKVTGPFMANEIVTASGGRSSGTTWMLFSTVFTVFGGGDYALTFSAGGKENSLGGFIDSVTLTTAGQRVSEVPLPAGAWLFLSALGAGGMLRRVKRQG